MNIFDIEEIKTMIENHPEMEIHFKSLYDRFKEALRGRSKPNFYIIPWETGLGKSTFIKSFLAACKSEGFKVGGSVLIALNTKAEIEEFAKGCGLEAEDYSTYTSDDIINKLGRGSLEKDEARVLFTTHAMVRQRLRKKSFKSAEEFYYKGQARTLRIWDEAAMRAEPVTIHLDHIVKLFAPVRPRYPEWIAGIEAFVSEARAIEAGGIVPVPTRFGFGKQFVYNEKAPPALSSEQREIVKALKAAAGCRLRVIDSGRYGKILVGAGSALPTDLAPMFIFDASARVRDTYKLWGEKGGNVDLLPPAIRSFENLTVKIWQTGCGIEVLEDTDARSRLLRGVAKSIDAVPGQKTLLIGYKARALFDIERELLERVAIPEDLRFLHWGRHYGTNEFADIQTLFVMGGFPQSEASYQASYLAASGIDVSEAKGTEWLDLRRSELKHNLLQAVSRGSVRKGADGGCGQCVVHLVMPANYDPATLVRETFPDCNIDVWEPFGTVLRGQARRVFDELQRIAEIGEVKVVSKAEVRATVGIATPVRFGQVLATRGLGDALRAIGISQNNKHFVFDSPSPSSASLERTDNVVPIKGAEAMTDLSDLLSKAA